MNTGHYLYINMTSADWTNETISGDFNTALLAIYIEVSQRHARKWEFGGFGYKIWFWTVDNGQAETHPVGMYLRLVCPALCSFCISKTVVWHGLPPPFSTLHIAVHGSGHYRPQPSWEGGFGGQTSTARSSPGQIGRRWGQQGAAILCRWATLGIAQL